MRKTLCALAAVSAMACGSAHADIDNYVAFLYGSNEVGAGDVDGFGLASVSIDDVTNTVSWAILASNILTPLTGAHIHEGAAGTNGPVRIDFDAALTGSLVSDFAVNITPDSASGFYVNLHNADFPGGAIRGQLEYVGTVSAPIPEPETYALMLAGLGAVGLLAARRRRPAA